MTNPTQRIYDDLWQGAITAYQRRDFKTDAHLHNLEADERDGVSLLIRLPPSLHPSIVNFIHRLRQVTLEQFFYVPQQFHITLLTLITALEKHDFDQIPLEQYKQVLVGVFRSQPPFDIHLRGITASRDAVMVQGFADDALNHLRDKLREALTAAGLGDGVDTRYKLVTAHATVMRYKTTPPNTVELINFLREERERGQDFGTLTVHQVDFVINDYYFLPHKSRTLQPYHLAR